MLRLFTKAEDCCGCGACASICPANNIEMQRTEEGFFYPNIISQTACLHCEQCLKVCPMKDKFRQNFAEREFFAGIATNEQIWMESSSGGAFSSICETYKDKNPVIFGACWNGLEVIMDFCDGVEMMGQFRKSKYIAAAPNQSYEKVKQFLDGGRIVIYSGTPCQINGLSNFLGKSYANLLLIDFACHGQGSPLVFEKWIKHLEKRHKQRIIKFNFREKHLVVDHINSNCCSFILEDGSKVVEHRDYYHHAYVNGLHMRQACMVCEYASKRKSDITLADFKNLNSGLPEFKELKNISTIIANTQKGRDVVVHLNNMQIFRPDPDFIVRYNPKLEKSIPGNRNRTLFMKYVCTTETDILRLIRAFSGILPSEWVEYHCATSTFKRLSGLLYKLDWIFRLKRKISVHFFEKRLQGLSN